MPGATASETALLTPASPSSVRGRVARVQKHPSPERRPAAGRQPGRHRPALRRLLALLAVLLGTLAASAPAHAASASVSVTLSADPTEGKPVTVTVAGTSAAARTLWVYSSLTSGCPSVPGPARGDELTGPLGEAVEGAFSRSYSITPGTEQIYVCAYVGEHRLSYADADGHAVILPRAAYGDVSVAVASGAAVGKPLVVTVTGRTDVARKLWVFHSTLGHCERLVPSLGGIELSPSLGEPVEGAFAKSYSITPANDGQQKVCAYLGTSRTALPNATGSADVVFPPPPVVPQDPPPAPPQIRVPGPKLVPPAALVAPANGVATPLNLSFAWTSAAPDRDVLVLSFQDPKRGWVPRLTVASYGYRELDPAKKYTPENLLTTLGQLLSPTEEIASFEAAGPNVAVRLGASLEPGRYRWSVLNGTTTPAASEERELTVQPPLLSTLRVKTKARFGRSVRSPGQTEMQVTVTPYAQLRIELRRNGRRTATQFAGDSRSSLGFSVPWSCRKPGGSYRYKVTARDATGKTITRSGSFRPITARECGQLRAYEVQFARYKAECQRRGGRAKEIRTKKGTVWKCVPR